eukprot:CAMPEP_0194532514 /NCGR_PEP_ID=MMETSP0253-20130528/70096_1 /TAXON_ID=2966 /ORGANISM="Noctiluca scintillans" /LENGTH=190 /DNA_ID=CAMNT_0039377969 /DNA_START=5 /DNA_END=577 /DNA_ORIENTATION=+
MASQTPRQYDLISHMERPALTVAAKSFMTSAQHPRYLEEKGRPPAPFPYYHPLTGHNGSYVAGSQYWQHPPDMGPHHPDHHISTMMASYRKRSEPSRRIERENPVTTRTHGQGTGFTTMCVPEWEPKDPIQRFSETAYSVIGSTHSPHTVGSAQLSRRVRVSTPPAGRRDYIPHSGRAPAPEEPGMRYCH